MIEVFKTNITSSEEAQNIVTSIHLAFAGYKANFDLWDCDNILRIASSTGELQIDHLILFLAELGCKAEVLPDVPLVNKTLFTSQFFPREAV